MIKSFNLRMSSSDFKKFDIVYAGCDSRGMVIKVYNTDNSSTITVYPLRFTKYKIIAWIERFLIRLFN